MGRETKEKGIGSNGKGKVKLVSPGKWSNLVVRIYGSFNTSY